MNKEPLVSVIIPTKNRAEMIKRAIKSVQNQTYKNLELIIIDDASTDNTPNVLESIKAADSRLTVHYNSQSLGGAGARNIGIKNASGDFVAFLDDDDEWLPQKTKVQLEFLINNENFGAASCWNLLKINDSVQKIQKPFEVTFKDLLRENLLGSFSFCFAHKNVFDKIGLLDETMPSAQDWDFWMRIIKNFNVKIIPEYLVVYHRHNKTRISGNYCAKVKGHELIYDKYGEYMDKNCVRHHKKYIAYYKVLAENSFLKRVKNLLAMFSYLSKKTDTMLFFDGIANLFLPQKQVEMLRSIFRKKMMTSKTRMLGKE